MSTNMRLLHFEWIVYAVRELMNSHNDIKLKIASGKLNEAIQSFLALVQQADVEHFNSAVLLSLSYHFYQNCHARGLMSLEDANRHFIQIAHQLLLMLDNINPLPEC